jgi:hypothetical protein
MIVCSEQVPEVRVRAACAAMGISRAVFFRRKRENPEMHKMPRLPYRRVQS